MTPDIALRQVVDRPAPHALEGGRVVGDQGEEHAVGLALGGTVQFRGAGIQHAPIRLQKVFDESAPLRPVWRLLRPVLRPQ